MRTVALSESIDEAWECKFLIREVLFVRSRLQKGSESENEIRIKNDYITLAWDKDKNVMRGKIKILSKALSSPYEIKERARESLHLVVELTKEKINAGFGHLEIKPHYCPNVIGINSTGYGHRPFLLHHRHAKEPVKWGFSRITSRSKFVE